MVRVCECCSNISIEQLKSIVSTEQIEVTCIGECSSYEGKSYGFINDDLVVSDTEQDFFQIVKNKLS